MGARCPLCRAVIADGQMYCGNCKSRLVWQGGTVKAELGHRIEKAGWEITKFGLLLLWVLVAWSLWQYFTR